MLDAFLIEIAIFKFVWMYFRAMANNLEDDKKSLIKLLRRYSDSEIILSAFLNVKRENFVLKKDIPHAYYDTPLPIGENQTISAPTMIAIMLHEADLGKNQNVLDIGTGSGYNAALIAYIVGNGGRVTSIERIKKIAEFGEKNLQKSGFENVEVVVGDGTCGYEKNAPYDRIIVTAGAPDVPQSLIDQLKNKGKLIIPVGSSHAYQDLYVAQKINDHIKVSKKGGCIFVPLIGEYGW